MGPIRATRIWANPYETHVEPGFTPHMGPLVRVLYFASCCFVLWSVVLW